MLDREIIQEMVDNFRKPGFDSDPQLEGRSYEKDRKKWWQERIQDMDTYLNEDKINNITIAQAVDLYKKARTGRMQRLQVDSFRNNGIGRIRKSLTYLLYGDSPIENRFDEVLRDESEYRLKGCGKDFFSTMLHMANPRKYPVLNEASIGGLRKLGLFSEPQERESIGEKYSRFSDVLRSLMTEFSFDHLGFVDSFLFCINDDKLKVPANVSVDSNDAIPKTPPLERPEQKDEPPSTREVPSRSKQRDSKVTNFVKEKENYCCQVCGLSIGLPDGEYFVEAHHIHPLGDVHEGLDNTDNVLCLCPNHHAEMDRGVFYVTPVSREIIYFDGQNEYHGQKLKTDHIIDADALRYHRDKICTWADSDHI